MSKTLLKIKKGGESKAGLLAPNRGQLIIDVFQTDKEFCVCAPIAGADPENIEVAVDNEMLIIRGKREKIETIEKKDYFYQECFWGVFERRVLLPEDIIRSKMTACLEKGILIIRAPRIAKVKKKKLKVHSYNE